MLEVDLNGPEFVGTPEYMSPEAIIGSPPTSYAADLWAFGVILFQMIVGRTPFKAPSPYLSFLLIKRANPRLPEALPPAASDLISRLLVLAPDQRLGSGPPGDLGAIKSHAFFDGISFDGIFQRPARRFPTLAERSHRALAVNIASARSRDQRLVELAPQDRRAVMHRLSRMKRLREPRVLRSFFSSLADARCLCARPCSRELIGLDHEAQGHWAEPFVFVHLSVGSAVGVLAEGPGHASLKQMVSAVNRLRPRVCVISGDLTRSTPDAATAFREHVSKISESIPLAFVGTAHGDGGGRGATYQELFGADYYGFWYGGMRALVLNSALIGAESLCSERAEAARSQEAWFDGEVEQGQLGGHHVVVFSHHLWFLRDPLEDAHVPGQTVPKEARLRWLRKCQGGKVRALFSGASGSSLVRRVVLPKTASENGREDLDEENGGGMGLPHTMEMVATPCGALEVPASGDGGGNAAAAALAAAVCGIRVVSVFEDRIEHGFFGLGEVPDRTELLASK